MVMMLQEQERGEADRWGPPCCGRKLRGSDAGAHFRLWSATGNSVVSQAGCQFRGRNGRALASGVLSGSVIGSWRTWGRRFCASPARSRRLASDTPERVVRDHSPGYRRLVPALTDEAHDIRASYIPRRPRSRRGVRRLLRAPRAGSSCWTSPPSTR